MATTTATEKKTGPINRFVAYLGAVRGELEKVTWPTVAELKSSTMVVLVFLAILAAMTGVMDAVFQRIVLLLFSLT